MDIGRQFVSVYLLIVVAYKTFSDNPLFRVHMLICVGSIILLGLFTNDLIKYVNENWPMEKFIIYLVQAFITVRISHFFFAITVLINIFVL